MMSSSIENSAPGDEASGNAGVAGVDALRDANTLFRDFAISSNTLINLSAELLAILTTLSQQQDPQNLPELHQYLLRSMNELHNRGLQAGYPPRMMEKVCYVLSATFDEEVMNTAWGQAACWENHALVARLFQQRNAGEVFFVLLEQARQNTPKMIDFIELLYLLLRLGFCGRYQNTDKHELAKLADDLYQEIRQHQKPGAQQSLPILSAPWRPLKVIRVRYYLPVVVLILVLTGIASHFWIQHVNETYTGLSDLHQKQIQAAPVQLSTSLPRSAPQFSTVSKPHQ